MTITLKVKKGRLKLRDIIAAESGFGGNTLAMVKFLSRFVVGDDGEYLPEDAALEIILDLNAEELPAVAAQLTAEIKRMQGEALPFENATS